MINSCGSVTAAFVLYMRESTQFPSGNCPVTPGLTLFQGKWTDQVMYVLCIYDINAQLKTAIDRFYANNSKLQGNKKTILMVACADDTMESVDGAVVSFERFASYMKWEVAGMVTANNSWTREDLKIRIL